MSKFKVGDRVRLVKPKDGLTVGKVYIVEQYGSYGDDPAWNSVRYDNGEWGQIVNHMYNKGYFELVTPAESELERLVRVLNEGDVALRTIIEKYPTQVVDDEGDPMTYYKPHTYSIVKPKFEPFTVGNGWSVKLDGETLHVGCQPFIAKFFQKDMQRAVKGDGSTINYSFIACRDGVKYGINQISWSDADRILAALEKAGIK